MVTEVEFKPVSLLDRIKKAESNDELLEIEIEGSGYKYASDKTRDKWNKASLARKVELLKASENSKKESNPKPVAKSDKKGTKERRKR